MKYLLTMMALAVLFCVSCNSSSSLSNADAGAQEQAQMFVEAQLTKCGDSYYGVRRIANDSGLYQFRDPKVSVKSQELAQDDKLNNIEWKGNSTFSAETWRLHDVTGKWGPWRQGFTALDIGLSARMVKQNGQWKFGPDGGLKPNSYEKVDCSRLPQ